MGREITPITEFFNTHACFRQLAFSRWEWITSLVAPSMLRTREEILKERRQLKAQYGQLFDSVSALLFRHDPIGIAFENEHTDEYDLETGTILPRLRGCNSLADALRVVHQEFVRWFDADNAGPEERYATIASEIWQLWQSQRTPARDEGSHT